MSETVEASAIDSGEPLAPHMVESSEGPEGVGGWLLVLCIWLTVIVPVLNLGLIGLDLVSSFANASRIPGLMALSAINAILVLILIGFSIFAGLALWRRRDPSAIKIVRIYLALFIGSKLLGALLPFIVGMDRDLAVQIATSVGGGMSGAVVFALGVQIYLQRSKRVRATYGLPDPASD